MIFARDVLAVGAAILAAAVLGALTIVSAVYPKREPLGYLEGAVRSHELRVSKLGGTRGYFDVRLDRGEAVKVESTDPSLVPGDRVCLRAIRRGELLQGHLVPMKYCSRP